MSAICSGRKGVSKDERARQSASVPNGLGAAPVNVVFTLQRMRRFIAAGFGAGLIPHRLYGSHNGAGTFGAAVAVVIGLFFIQAPWWIDAMIAIGAIAVSLWAAAPFATDGEDPAWVAIDEVAGTLVAMIGLSGWGWVVAVVVARLLDIYKVAPGIAQAEDLHGAVGVTFDDVIAGLYGLAAGWLVLGLT